MSKKRYKLHIIGKVQGVWYRASARNKAIELGLFGFIRNEANGSVYAEVEGTPTQLEAFVQWAKQGPDQARVEEVLVEEAAILESNSFEINR